MEPLKQEFLDLSDKFFARFTARLDGLTDEEYWWEPAPDAWSLVRRDDGKLHMKWGRIFDELQPVTTIAWRYTHICDLLCEERCATYIGVEPEAEDLFADACPGDVATARELLDKAFARWKRYVTATDESKLYTPVGPIAGQWAERTRATFVLHIIDEAIHHGAEIGVLRDIYAAQRAHDPAVSALLRRESVEASEIERLKRERPDLTLYAAATANYDAIGFLMELGFGIEGRNGRTPLHHAASEGDLGLMQVLIDAGADLEAKDPIFNATPREWAAFFDKTDAVEALEDAYRLRSLNA